MLHPFCDDIQIEGASQSYDRFDDRSIVVVRDQVAHERLVYLRRGQGKLAKIVERGVPCPEIVDRDTETYLSQLREGGYTSGGVLHEHTLGQPELDETGFQARLTQKLLDLPSESLLLETLGS